MSLILKFKYSLKPYKYSTVIDESVSVFVWLVTYNFMGELFVSRE